MRRRDFLKACAAGVLGLAAPVPRIESAPEFSMGGLVTGRWPVGKAKGQRYPTVMGAPGDHTVWTRYVHEMSEILCLTPADIARAERKFGGGRG